MADAITNGELLSLFDAGTEAYRASLAKLVSEVEQEAVLAEARTAFERLIPEMPYRDRRSHVMFGSTFAVFLALALYQALRGRGVDVHAVGRAILAGELPSMPSPMPEPALEVLRCDAEASQREAAENEFVFAFVPRDDESDWGIDVLQCAVCHAFANHDAMELVPYMCATDDVVSDQSGQGLRRTGTIGLGAHRCDFRYKHGGDPLRLASQYPEKIRLTE